MIYFFSAQFNNNSNKKNCPTHGFNPIQPNPCGLGWVGLNFFLTHHDGLGKKKPPQPDPIQPIHTLKSPTSYWYTNDSLSPFVKRLFQENFNTILYEKSQKLLKNSITFFFFIKFFFKK